MTPTQLSTQPKNALAKLGGLAFALAMAIPACAQTIPSELHLQPGTLPSHQTQSAASVETLTLQQAHQLAISNHPQLRASQFASNEAHDETAEARSAYYPTLSAD